MESPIHDRLNESKFFYEQGLAHWRNGHSDMAMSCLDECIRIGHPYFKAAALVTLGSLLTKLGDRASLLVYLRKIAELPEDESKFVPRVVMGRTLTALGEYDRAATAYQRASQVTKPDPILILNYVELELIRGRYDSAAELLKRLHEASDPNAILMTAVLRVFLAALSGRYDDVNSPLRSVLRVLASRGVPVDFYWDFTDVSPALARIADPEVSYLVNRVVCALRREINIEDFVMDFPQLTQERHFMVKV